MNLSNPCTIYVTQVFSPSRPQSLLHPDPPHITNVILLLAVIPAGVILAIIVAYPILDNPPHRRPIATVINGHILISRPPGML